MTGNDLIKWIQDNNAGDLDVIIEHRDEGGSYRTAERLGEFQMPALCHYSNEYEFDVMAKDPNAILL